MRIDVRKAILVAMFLALAIPSARAGDDAKPDEKGVVRDVLISLMRRPEGAQADATPWLLWSRYGVAGSPVELVGDLDEFVLAMRGTAAGVFPEVGRLDGPATHRHVLARVEVLRKTYAVFLVEEEGWKVVRADRLEEKASPPPPPAPALAAELTKRIDEGVAAVLAAIDASDAKGYADRIVELSGTTVKRPEAKDVGEQLMTLHGKYGARPRKVGAAFPEEAHGRTHYAVPVLFGDDEALLYLVLVEVEGRMLLSNFSEGRPADFVGKPAK